MALRAIAFSLYTKRGVGAAAVGLAPPTHFPPGALVVVGADRAGSPEI
jgi:hypothetical protein